MGRVRIQPYNTIFIGNLPYELTEEEILNLFSNKDSIIRSFFPKTKRRLQGIGFITFKTEEDCENAIAEVHKTNVKGRQVVARWADHRKDKDDPNQEVEVEYVSDDDDDYDRGSKYGSRRDSRDKDRRRDRTRNYERDRNPKRRRDSDSSSDEEDQRRRRKSDNLPPPNPSQFHPGYNPMVLQYYWMQQMANAYPAPPLIPPNMPPSSYPYMPNGQIPLNVPLPTQPIGQPPNAQAIPPPPTNLLPPQTNPSQTSLPAASPLPTSPLQSSIPPIPPAQTANPMAAQDPNQFPFAPPSNQSLLAMVNSDNNSNQP